MKREQLKELGLEAEVIDSIMALHGKTIESKKNELSVLEEKVKTYEAQMKETNDKIKEFESLDIDGIKKSTADLQAKYEADTKELQLKLDKQAYDFKAKEYLSNFKYANDLTKEAIENKFLSKEFKLEEGKFLGADDFIKELKESQPNAFIEEQTKEPPTFGTPASKNTASADDGFEKAFKDALGLK